MKKIIILLTILQVIICNNVLAQSKRGNQWVTGRGTTVMFENNVVTTKYIAVTPWHYFTGGNSAICDTNGNLILCSDGFNIYDSVGNYIDGGDTLVPVDYYNHYGGWSDYSQSSIFLPIDSSKYYFITPANSAGNLCFSCHNDAMFYSVIDMYENGGAGKVIKRMIPFAENGQFRKTQMMACRHSNGKDWWLLKQAGDSSRVHKFLFTQDTVYNMGYQQFNEPVWGAWDIRGMSTFNVNGNKYASTSHGSSTGKIFMADFDRCYGILSNPKEIVMPVGSQHIPNDTTITEHLSVALAYSPNSEILYVISMSNIYQYDLQNDSWYHVAGLDTSYQKFQDYDASYIGADGKLYIGNFGGGSKQMSVINNPDVKGAGCNFCPRCLRLDSLGIYTAAGTPPCMPNYSLGKDSCYPLGVSHYMDKSNILVAYPNPASTVLYIKSESKEKRELYNSVGQLLSTTKENEIDVHKFGKGIYYIKVGNTVRKIIIE
jgi:hypothetical protein